MGKWTIVKICCFLTLFLVGFVILPHMCHAESVFGFSEDILLTFEEQDLLAIQIEPELAGMGPQNSVVFNPAGTYSNTPNLSLTGDKGQILSNYHLLSPRFINLILYHKGDLSDPEQHYTIEAQSNIWDALTVSYGYDASGTKAARQSVNLAFNPASFASFSAGYGVISSKLGAVQPVAAYPASVMNPGIGRTGPEDIVVKQLGLSIFPTNYSSITADYMTVNEKGETNGTSTATFGLKLGAKKTELNATYQMHNQDNAYTTHSAGLEFGLVDLAHLRAVYSMTEDHQVAEAMLKSTVDLGLNLNLAENSALNFQYKLVLPDSEPTEEQRAEATLEIRF